MSLNEGRNSIVAPGLKARDYAAVQMRIPRTLLQWVIGTKMSARILGVAGMFLACSVPLSAGEQYILFNRAPGQGMNKLFQRASGLNSSRRCWHNFRTGPKRGSKPG
jgi:hypothetical protein